MYNRSCVPVSLLATKLSVPPPRANTVGRPALAERLLSGADHPGSFALLSAPAGSGKTTLLSDLAVRLRRPAAWVSLDEGDNDLPHFWTYLLAACGSVLDGVGKTAGPSSQARLFLPAGSAIRFESTLLHPLELILKARPGVKAAGAGAPG